jgi:DNA-binding transcriptional regulator YiaG
MTNLKLKKNPPLGPDDPTKWAAELAELDHAMAGHKTKYWRRVKYPKPAGKIEARAVRKSLHISQLAFARALGVSLSTIRSWEQGTRRPDGLATKVLRSLLVRPGLLSELAQAA